MTARIVRDDVAGRAAAAAVLRAGGIVALPTDTVYGIACALDTPGGIEALFAAKRRPPEKGVMLLLADAAQAPTIGEWPASAAALAEAFWPGGLTVIVPQRADVPLPAALTGGAPTIGLRAPDHPAPRALAAAVGPLPTTSANVSGLPEATTAQEIVEQLGDAIELVLDGGPAGGGPASTVVDCTVDPPRILRRGAVRRSELEGALGRDVEGMSRPIDLASAQAAVSELVGLTVNGPSSRAVDMEVLDFGSQVDRINRLGRTNHIGQFGLHVQAAWRIVEGGRIVVGYSDIRRTPTGVDQESWDPDLGGKTARDELIGAWLVSRPARVVTRAEVRPTRDLVLTFDDVSAFETLVDEITGDQEQWRLLRRDDETHVVARTGGFSIDG